MASYSTINERYIQDIDDEDDDITAVSSSSSSSFKQRTQFTLSYDLVIPTESSLTEKSIDSFPLTLIADRFLSLVDMLHFITDDYTVKMNVLFIPSAKYYIDNSPNDKSLSTSIFHYS